MACYFSHNFNEFPRVFTFSDDTKIADFFLIEYRRRAFVENSQKIFKTEKFCKIIMKL